MKLISLNLPESYMKALEMLVLEGKFPNRSEAIRVAVRDLIRTEFLIEESIKKEKISEIIEKDLENEFEPDLLI
ncbi:MAG: ribbon-helix-helix domain-containing protein [Promethearchaeia archaeon]